MVTFSRLAVVLLTGAATVAGCTPTATPTPAPTIEVVATSSAGAFTPTISSAACPDDVTSQVVITVSCGYLTVLANRAVPAEGTIRLFFVRFDPPGGTTTADPVITLGHLATQDGYGDMGGGGQRTHRVLYLIDPRGIGHSEPSLACPEVTLVGPDLAGLRLRDPARQDSLARAVTACHDRLVGQGIDLAAYDLAANAADLEDLRTALGLGSWNLMSNGDASRIAFEVARRYPQGLRSLVIDSPSLPDPDFLTVGPAALDGAIATLVADCSGEPACVRRYPDLAAEIRAAVTRLDDHPQTFDITGTVDAIRLGHPIRAVVDGAGLVRILRWSLGSGGGAKAVVGLHTIGQVIDGSLDATDPGVVALASDTGDCLGLLTICERPTLGALYSIVCRDMATPDAASLQAALDGRPAYADVFSPSPLLLPCRAWVVAPASADAGLGLTGGVPTLVLRGALDPYSAPTDSVKAAAAAAPNVYTLDVPNQSYNALGYTECPRAIRNAWIDAPTSAPADTTCLGSIPGIDLAP